MQDEDHWNGWRVIGRGAHRICVGPVGPADECLKFVIAADAAAPSSQWPRIAAAHAQELRFYRTLRQQHGAAVDRHVAACLGVESTPFGPALRCRRILQPDGGAARSLHQYLGGPLPVPKLVLDEAIDRLEGLLRAWRIPLFDVNPANLLLRDGPSGTIDLVVVDLKSALRSKEWLPLSRWVPPLRDRKLARRFGRLRARLDAAFAANAS